MNTSTKVISMLSLLQLFFIVGGYLVMRETAKVHGLFYGSGSDMSGPHITELTKFMYAYGLWLLVVPVAWCLSAAFGSNTGGGGANISALQLALGLGLAAGLGAIFVMSGWNALEAAFPSW